MSRSHFIPALFIAIVITAGPGCKSNPDNSGEEKGKEKISRETPEAKKITGFAAEELMRQSAHDGELEKVTEMIEGGVDVNSPDSDGHTALMFAAFNGHSDIVLKLLENKASLDRRDLMGRTALLYAATGPFPGTVKILLDKGAEPNIVDSDEHFSPLMHAAAEGNLDVVKILIEYKANPELTDVDGDDAETFARQAGHLEVADYLKSIR